MSKPLTMMAGQEELIREVIGQSVARAETGGVLYAAPLLKEIDALRASLAAAEAKLAAYESQARAQGDTILDLNAKLADEVRLADALLRELNRRQDASFSLTTDDVIADYEAARQAGKAVEREERCAGEGKR